MELSGRKPKMVFFEPPRLHSYAYIQEAHDEKARKGLSEFFDVVVVNRDCDYAEVCDIHKPDIALFASGSDLKTHRIRIRNTSCFPDVPKAGLTWWDVFSPARSTFLTDMENWGIETFFTTCPTMAEYIPDIADQLFYWPPFVDTDLFRDYGERKTIPVLLTGDFDTPSLQYSWRRKIKEPLRKNYPCLTVPHPWYGPSYQVFGEEYARLINASMVVPTCGAMCQTLVMKHLEIPAAKACLITERTPAVEAAGFVNMRNCVFAEDIDIVEKLNYLFKNRTLLEQITTSGYELIRSRHAAKHRPQILQWLHLRQCIRAGERIVQQQLFGDLEIVNATSGTRTEHIIVGTADRKLLREGDEKLTAGKYDEAEALYLHCLKYVSYMPEAELRVAICKLYQGDANAALDWISRRMTWSADSCQATGSGALEWPYVDPVEWAYLIVATVCRGNLYDAIIFSAYFPSMSHPQLALARWAVCVLAGKQDEAANFWREVSNAGVTRKTIHKLPQPDIYDNARRLCKILLASKRCRFAIKLFRSIPSSSVAAGGDGEKKPNATLMAAEKITAIDEDHADMTYVLEAMHRMRRQTLRIRLGCRLKNILKARVKGFVSAHPQLKTKIKYVVSERLRVQEW